MVILKRYRYLLLVVLLSVAWSGAGRADIARYMGKKVIFVDATSKTLLRQRQIEFSPEVEIDIDIEASRSKLDTALKSDADYVVVFDVAIAKANRRVLNLHRIESMFATRTERVVNPEWKLAKMESLMQRMDGTSDASTAGLKLVNTPKFIDENIYVSYEFEQARVRGNKGMTVNYYVIDLKNKKYFKSLFEVNEEKQFKIAYRLHKRDKDRERHLSIHNTEKEVKDWENRPLTLMASQLFNQYDKKRGSSKKLTSVTALRKTILKDKNTAIAEYKKADYQYGVDKRLDSVVVIYTGRNSVGTGFFVTPDIVLTNWHVIEGSEFVELKMHGGAETFGKIIGKDVRLDLALVKVQSRGKPVRFYNKRKLDLGLVTEAIGHPHRFEFSVNRGAISAIRKFPSINLPGGGGKKVLYIQTDTPVNPGNSGGPLFYKDEVVGVNTWVIRKDIAEGINFSIHYGEVLQFLEDVLPEYSRQ